MKTPDAWPDLAGRLAEGRHVLPVRIYYEDTDFSGVVYHGSYVRFMERGRTDFLRLMGFGHVALGKGEHSPVPLAFAVRRMAIEFLKPARIDDLVEVETHLHEVAGARIILTQTIRRAGQTLVTAEVTVVMIDSAGRAQRLPEGVAELFAGGPRLTGR